MTLLSDIPSKNTDNLFNVVIEISMNSSTKYEYHDDVGSIVVDRFLHTAFSYPFNYGFIPQTWSEDHDAVDVLVLSSQPVATGTIISCRIAGVIETQDEEGIDPKIVAFPGKKIDPMYASYDTVEQLPEYLRNKISHFYEHYKELENNKWVKIAGWQSRAVAEKIVEESILRYQQSR